MDPATHLFEHRARRPITVEYKVPGRCRESNDSAGVEKMKMPGGRKKEEKEGEERGLGGGGAGNKYI